MARIVSDTPGRLRVRLRPERRHPAVMARVSAHLEKQEGIAGVETNAATGSVTVRYDPVRRGAGDVFGLLHDLGVVVEQLAEVEEVLPLSEPGHSAAAQGIVGAVDDLDRRLSRLTGRKVDLKLLFPVGLGGLGVYQLLRNGFEMGEIPGYVLLWYAFDAFFKLHVRAADATRRPPETIPQQPGRSQAPAHG